MQPEPNPMLPDWVSKLPVVQGRYAYNRLLSSQTWFQVGGPAQVLFKPKDEADLIFFLKNKPLSIPITVIGAGSNILVRDGGVEGIVIRLTGRAFSFMDFEGVTVHVGGGALDRVLALQCRENNIGGLEFLVGIPGSIGGAICMNAGAYGREIKDVFEGAYALDEKGNKHWLTGEDLSFSYRHSALPAGWIITSVKLKGVQSPFEKIQGLITEFLAQREATQPVKGRTGGSTFKNSDSYKAWKLIDQAGCRGLKVGGAEVSSKHCNFLLNTGTASAIDLETLGNMVHHRVLESSGISLEWEIIRLGKRN